MFSESQRENQNQGGILKRTGNESKRRISLLGGKGKSKGDRNWKQTAYSGRTDVKKESTGERNLNPSPKIGVSQEGWKEKKNGEVSVGRNDQHD